MTVVARRFVSIPERTASATWSAISESSRVRARGRLLGRTCVRCRRGIIADLAGGDDIADRSLGSRTASAYLLPIQR